MPGQGELEGGKRQPPPPQPNHPPPPPKQARRRSKTRPLVSAHQARARGPGRSPPGGATMPLLPPAGGGGRAGPGGGRGGGDYRDEPWTQWCFRAESSRSSPARSIPSPTVTAGTRLGPSERIICARMAVKRSALRLSTHPTPRHCCVCHLSVRRRFFSGAVAKESVWRLDQRQSKLEERRLSYTLRQADVSWQRCECRESYGSAALSQVHHNLRGRTAVAI